MQLRLATLAAASAIALMASQAASAATVDALTSFNGTNGAGGFGYFIFTGDTTTVASVPPATCPLNTQCLQSPSDLNEAGFYKAGPLTPSVIAGDGSSFISLPANELILVPSELGAGVQFTAPTAGAYGIQLRFDSLNTQATGVYLRFFSGSPDNLTGVTLLADGVSNALLFSDTLQLQAGQIAGFFIRPGAVAMNDETGFNFTVTTDQAAAVPEPATWGMMILGFSAMGLVLRRRSVANRRPAVVPAR